MEKEKNPIQNIKMSVNPEEKEMFDFLKAQGYAVSAMIKIILRERAVAAGYQPKKEG